jgi:hypothetical protein
MPFVSGNDEVLPAWGQGDDTNTPIFSALDPDYQALKVAEAALHAVLCQVRQDRTRVTSCTRWTGATSCRQLMQQPVELAPLARPQRM